MRCPDVSVNNVHETGNTRANFVFREVGSGEGDQAFGSNIFVALHVHVWTVCSTASVISLLCIIFIEPMFGVISRWWPEPTVLWNRTNSSLLDSQKTKQNKSVVPAVRKHVVVFLLFSFFFKTHFKTHSFHSTTQERSFICSVFYIVAWFEWEISLNLPFGLSTVKCLHFNDICFDAPRICLECSVVSAIVTNGR